MKFRIPVLGLFLMILVAIVPMASADPISIVKVTEPLKIYQHSTTSPCIISAQNCPNNGAITWGNIAGNGTTVSPVYTAGQLAGVMGTQYFWIGFDVNQSNTAQTLTAFSISVNGVVIWSQNFTDVPNNVPAVHNGTGYADYLLKPGSGGLAFFLGGTGSYDANATIQFSATLNNLNDGGEQFFLIGQQGPDDPTPVPEPASMFLLGSGLVGAGRMLRKKLQK